MTKMGRPPRVGKKASTERFEMRMTLEERRRWQRAAGDRPLVEWIREVCEAAAAR